MRVAATIDHPAALLQFHSRRRLELIRQSEATECGLCCLAMVAGYHGYRVDIASLRQRFEISLKGTSLKTLLVIADELGLTARPMSVELTSLDRVSCPAIIHWNLNHFVVLAGVRRSINGPRYLVHDPARGLKTYTSGEMSAFFTGVAVEFSPGERFEKKTEIEKLQISQLWSSVTGLRTLMLQVLGLSILLQLITFVSPFYVQLAVDTAAPAFDREFLTALAIGFAALAIINTLTSFLREMILLRLGNSLTFQLVSNLFRHLVRLPMGYFDKRHTGDVISRFESTQPVSELLSKGFIAGVIDGLMSILTLVVMAIYSPLLAALAFAAVAIYLVTRLLYFRSLQMANVSLIAARAAEASVMIETIRGMAAIKLFAREADRHRLWQKKRASVVNSNIRLSSLQVVFDSASAATLAVEHLLFVYIAIGLVIDARFTVGMMFAVQAYKQQFVGASTRLINFWMQLKIVDVHLTRVADIALAPAEYEESAFAIKTSAKPIKGALSVRDVYFSYGRGEDDVLKGVSLEISAGETVAIIGPSGGGKTTLLKVLVGLHVPSSGRILVDMQPLGKIGLRRYRSCIGTVLQDDVLYAGSLAENICFFDAEVDMKRVRRCAQLACVHHEIAKMPMGYETLVGDMGSSLSGGQKQRILLARALYPEPSILFLDESTAHLDVRTEAAVNESIEALGMTRILVAHRPETIRSADRAIALVGGKVVENAERLSLDR